MGARVQACVGGRCPLLLTASFEPVYIVSASGTGSPPPPPPRQSLGISAGTLLRPASVYLSIVSFLCAASPGKSMVQRREGLALRGTAKIYLNQAPS